MKQIGRDGDGNYIVLMTEGEVATFNALKAASDGRSNDFNYVGRDRPLIEADYLPALIAISDWTHIKDQANRLHELANQIEHSINSVPVPKDGER